MTDIRAKTNQHQRLRLYGNKRLFRSILCSIIASAWAQDAAYGFLMYPIASVLWDWWFFSYRGVKESTNIPQWYLDQKKMFREDVDKYVRVTMYAKRTILLVAVVWSIVDAGMGVTIFTLDVFIHYSLLMMLFMLPLVAFQIIRTPFFRGDSWYQFHGWDSDMFDVTNPIGYYNPVSPNYIHRH